MCSCMLLYIYNGWQCPHDVTQQQCLEPIEVVVCNYLAMIMVFNPEVVYLVVVCDNGLILLPLLWHFRVYAKKNLIDAL